MSEAEAPSPLAEAQADSLDELFLRFDKAISDRKVNTPSAQKDLQSIVENLRRQREQWLLAESQGAKRGPQRKTNETSLKDLGLD